MPQDYTSDCWGCTFKNAGHLPDDIIFIRSRPLSMEDNAASILLIFQTPGLDEWETGRPISSTNPRSAGARLRKAFERLGTSRANYNITNAVQCFPGKKPQTNDKRPRDNKPPAEVIRRCSHWLRQDIEAREYERIVVFGDPAKKAVQAHNYGEDPRFRFVRHPSSGLFNAELDAALCD